jgi:galactose mutarotase-like enzyme
MLRAVNLGQRRAPLGVGFHPYLTFGTIIDGFNLIIPASSYVDLAGSAGGPTMDRREDEHWRAAPRHAGQGLPSAMS